jgi:hypothetical protein
MKILIALLSLLAVFTACNTSKPVAANEEIISVLHGTNFGHCRGYCRKEVVFYPDQVDYFEVSVDSARNPVKVENFKNSAAWKSIVDKIDWNKFKDLKESYGCPDCADGGSEYIEIKTINGTKRVTIEFNKEMPDLEPLLTELRSQRKKLLE